MCTEIIEYTAPDEVAVCNLASIALNRFVSNGKFDFNKLYQVTEVVTKNLNRIIDINYYPVPEVRPHPPDTPILQYYYFRLRNPIFVTDPLALVFKVWLMLSS